jgi:hypothetical protein
MHRSILVATLAVAMAGCVGSLSEDFESNYPDVAAARADGAFTHGWLPEILPENATDIWEMHNLDTNLTWACFSTPDGPDGARLLLGQRGAARVKGPIDRGPSGLFGIKEWWPPSMSSGTVETYELKEEGRYSVLVGFDPAAGKVRFHRR